MINSGKRKIAFHPICKLKDLKICYYGCFSSHNFFSFFLPLWTWLHSVVNVTDRLHTTNIIIRRPTTTTTTKQNVLNIDCLKTESIFFCCFVFVHLVPSFDGLPNEFFEIWTVIENSFLRMKRSFICLKEEEEEKNNHRTKIQLYPKVRTQRQKQNHERKKNHHRFICAITHQPGVTR